MIKVSKQWLQEWLDVEVPIEQLVEQLTMIGLEVDDFSPVSAEFSDVVVGEVLEVTLHPQADKLHVCKVDVGKETPLNIVCGAPNVDKGLKAPVALLGASLAGFKIEKKSLRGIESEGMLCSAHELGLTEVSKQLLELPQDAPTGQNLRDYLQLNDVSIDVELTANRGDCASVRGIAREVSVVNRCRFLEPEIKAVSQVIKDTFPIVLMDASACSRYVGRIIRNVDVHAKTPMWMQERLRRSGLHSIHPIVDVTNYVMLELGQPMHAFDFDKVSGRIEVRFAHSNEKLKLLNGEEVVLNTDTLVIADQNGAIAMAGIMGGEPSSIAEQTKNIFLESAFFNPVHVINRARQYGLQTDSSYRFEHGVDPQLQAIAIERATQLLLEIVGGQPGPLLEAKHEDSLPKMVTINFRIERVERLLGIKIERNEIEDILTRLGMRIENRDQTVWKIYVPSHRFDVAIEEDLIEEIARMYGYHNFPVSTVFTHLHIVPFQKEYNQSKRICAVLKNRDYHEIVTYSFIDPKDQKLLDSNEKPLSLINPMTQEMSVMRTNLWPGLINSLIYNLHRQQDRVRLFEIGLRFRYVDEEVLQEEVLAGLIYGHLYPEQWGVESRQAHFFDVKNDVESLLHLTNQFSEFTFRSQPKHDALHPGQSATLFFHDQLVGYLGMLHPQITQGKGIKGSIYVFEILSNVLQTIKVAAFKPISKFPAIRRDIALIVDQTVTSQTILEEIRRIVGEILIDLRIFDVYKGQGIEQGRQSIALGLTLQHPEKTLQDEEANGIIQRIVEVMERNFKAELRK